MLPETLALMHYYLSRAVPAPHGVLQELPGRLGLVLDRGEPEAAWIPRLADGIFRSIDVRDAYDHLEATGSLRSFAGGNSTGAYADRHGTLSLVCEVPYWSDASAADASPSTVGYAAALADSAAGLYEVSEVLTDTLAATAGATSIDSPFLRASRFFAPMIAAEAGDVERRRAGVDPGRAATVAEVASLAESVHMFRLRYGGMLLRALDAELAVGNVRPTIRAARHELDQRYARWCVEAQAATPITSVPIRSLVATGTAPRRGHGGEPHRATLTEWMAPAVPRAARRRWLAGGAARPRCCPGRSARAATAGRRRSPRRRP